MEIYELSITKEEARDYHKFIYQLKALAFGDWVKAYIKSVIFVLILSGIVYTVSVPAFTSIWLGTNVAVKAALFTLVFLAAALQRSKSVQLNRMLEKYLIHNMPQEFLNGSIQLKKIKVEKDKLVLYYRRFHY
jgi:hypothetical protein